MERKSAKNVKSYGPVLISIRECAKVKFVRKNARVGVLMMIFNGGCLKSLGRGAGFSERF